MESRVLKKKSKTKQKRSDFLFSFLLVIIAIISSGGSIMIWDYSYRTSEYFGLFSTIQQLYVMVIGFFIMLAGTKLRFIIQSIKGFFKILFTVWVVLIIQFSTLDQIEQNVWIIASAFFFAYFEVLVDLNELIQHHNNVSLKKLKFITKERIKGNSMTLSIILLALFHSILPYFLKDILDRIH